MKKIYSLVLVIGFLFTQMIGVSAKQISTPYTTEGECTQVRAKNEIAYGGLQRSDCFEENGYYKYYLCSNNEDCGDISDNPHRLSIAVGYRNLLDRKLRQLTTKSVTELETLKSKIESLESKYASSQVASSILKYFTYELSIIIEKKQESGEDDLAAQELLCTLTGDCGGLSQGETNLQTSQTTVPVQPTVSTTVTTNTSQEVKNSWPITDPYGFGSNKTAGPFKNPDGQTVYIIDEGNGITRAPSCVNGLGGNYCANQGLFFTGARTDEIRSIRLKTKEGLSSKFTSTIRASKIAFGIEDVYLPGKFDFVLATKPGLMKSDLVSNNEGESCSIRNNYSGSIKVFPKTYNGYYKNSGCTIPEGTLLYMNIRAVTAKCDEKGILCNSTIVMGSSFGSSRFHTPTTPPTPQPATPAPRGGTQVRGECGDTLNTCRVGTFVDRADTDEGHVFSCEGEGIIPQWCTQSYATGEGEDGTDTTDNNWPIKDPYQVGANKTAGPYNHPNGNDKVYIIDRASPTLAPSCINGVGTIDCNDKYRSHKGATTNEIWSIRLHSNAGYKSATFTQSYYSAAFNYFYKEGKFDYVFSTKPGLMETDFLSTGNSDACTIKNSSAFQKRIFSPKAIQSGKYNFIEGSSYCIIPEDTPLYLNMQAVSAECSTKDKLCTTAVRVPGSFHTKTGGDGGIRVPTTPTPPRGGTANCKLGDGTTLAHGGNNGIYSLYSKNGCGLIGGLACDNGRITSAGFSPNIDDTPKDWYNTKRACQGISSDKNMSVALELKGITKYSYVVDYNNLSAIDISISRNSSILKPNTVSKRKILNLTSMSVGKCGAFFFHGGGKIIGKNQPASQWKDFNTYLSFCKTGAQSFSVKHRVKLKNAAGQYVFKAGEVNHGSFNLTTKKYTPSSDVTSSSVK